MANPAVGPTFGGAVVGAPGAGPTFGGTVVGAPGAGPTFGGTVFGATPVQPGEQADSLVEAIVAGVQSSATGLALRGKLPSQVLGEDAPWYHRLGAGVGGVVADFPLSIAGAIGGASAGTAVAPGVGSAIGGAAGAFAAPMALRDALMAAYSGNHAASWSGVWDIAWSAIKGGVKGAVIGGVTGGAGKLAAPFIAPAGAAVAAATGSKLAGKLAVGTGQVGVELTALTGTAAALEGHLPTQRDFLDNAILLVGMKGATAAARGLRNIYAEAGRRPEQVLADARKNPEIALDLKPVEAPSAAEPMVTAYHGSQYTFEKFDPSKIGTGEGGRAYGHGLYFAESQVVAGYHADATTRATLKAPDISRLRESIAKAAAKREVLQAEINAPLTQQALARGLLPEGWVRTREANIEYLDRSIERLSARLSEAEASAEPKVYKVQIPQRVVDSMLDWDRPLAEQAPHVRSALLEHPDPMIAGTAAKWGHDIKAMLDRIGQRLGGEDEKAAVSAALSKAGITGVRYLDAASRGAGSGSRNYVVFDAANVRVTARNGELIGQPVRAYEPIAAEERLKAAYNEPRPEFLRKSMDVLDKALKLDPNDLPGDPVKYEYVVDSAVAKGLTRVLADAYNAEYTKKTRGVVPNAQSALEGLKSIVNGTLPDHAAGWAGNAGEIAARAHLIRGSTNFAMAELTKFKEIPAAEQTPAMKLRVAASLDRVAMLYGEFLGVRAEAGRSLQILGAIKRDPSFLGEAEALVAAIEKSKGNLDSVAAMAAGFKTPAEMLRFATDWKNATTKEMVIEAWKASILTGPMTLIANPLGNVTKWLIDIPESVIAATLTAAERKLQGDPLTWAQYKARALSPLYGARLGALDGLKLAAEIMRGKESAHDKAEQYRGGAIPGKTGRVVRTVFDVLQAQDALFRVPAERAQAFIMAVDRLVKEGVHPETAEGRALIAQYIARPETGLSKTAGQAAIAKIRQAGLTAVFAQRQGPHLEMAMRAVRGTLAEFVLPFLNTPANLFSWAIQHTPGLNFLSPRWRADWAAGGERQSHAVARIIIGAGLTGTALALAQDGAITGGGLYLTPEQRAAKLAAGWQPYSFRIDGKYYSYQRIEPVAKVLGVGADIFELATKTKDEQDKAKIMMLAVMLFGNATVSTTYMSGLSNAMQALVDPVRRGENFLEQYVMSLVPKAIGQAAVIADPHKREIDGVVDAIQSQLPIFRERLLPKRDAWGTPVKSDRWLSVMPIATSEASKDKVRAEAARLSIAIADAPKFLTERGPFNQTDKRVNLQPEQRDIIREVSGTHAMNILAPIVNSPDWARLPEYVKVDIFNNVIEKTRKLGIQEAAPPDDPTRVKKRQEIIDRINREWQAVQGK